MCVAEVFLPNSSSIIQPLRDDSCDNDPSFVAVCVSLVNTFSSWSLGIICHFVNGCFYKSIVRAKDLWNRIDLMRKGTLNRLVKFPADHHQSKWRVTNDNNIIILSVLLIVMLFVQDSSSLLRLIGHRSSSSSSLSSDC